MSNHTDNQLDAWALRICAALLSRPGVAGELDVAEDSLRSLASGLSDLAMQRDALGAAYPRDPDADTITDVANRLAGLAMTTTHAPLADTLVECVNGLRDRIASLRGVFHRVGRGELNSIADSREVFLEQVGDGSNRATLLDRDVGAAVPPLATQRPEPAPPAPEIDIDMVPGGWFCATQAANGQPLWINARNVAGIFARGGVTVVALIEDDFVWHVRESPEKLLTALGNNDA